MYVAGKTQKIEREVQGILTTVELQPGDPVPECVNWPTFKACLNTGHVVWAPDSKNPKFVPPGVPGSAVKGGFKSITPRDEDDDENEDPPVVQAAIAQKNEPVKKAQPAKKPAKKGAKAS